VKLPGHEATWHAAWQGDPTGATFAGSEDRAPSGATGWAARLETAKNRWDETGRDRERRFGHLSLMSGMAKMAEEAGDDGGLNGGLAGPEQTSRVDPSGRRMDQRDLSRTSEDPISGGHGRRLLCDDGCDLNCNHNCDLNCNSNCDLNCNTGCETVCIPDPTSCGWTTSPDSHGGSCTTIPQVCAGTDAISLTVAVDLQVNSPLDFSFALTATLNFAPLITNEVWEFTYATDPSPGSAFTINVCDIIPGLGGEGISFCPPLDVLPSIAESFLDDLTSSLSLSSVLGDACIFDFSNVLS